MLLPLGVYDDGSFAGSLVLDGVPAELGAGAVPMDVLEGKGTPGSRGMVGGEFNAEKLERAGWAVMFGASVDPQIRKNLTPLLEHRKAQVGEEGVARGLYKELPPPAAGQTASQWLVTQGTNLAVVDPEKGVPYYVMIVAGPEEVSFEFQYELDLYWGVGRLWLDTPAAYERYAHSVIAYENAANQVATSRQMVIFAPSFEGQDNGAGRALCDFLIDPMLAANPGKFDKFKLQSFVGPEATKQKLYDVLAGTIDGGTPALMFTGSHGLLKARDSKQLAIAQGAILCEPWMSPPKGDNYYGAWDLDKTAKIHGMVHFVFACYGLGWPQYDTYNYQEKVEISPAPMMARLPQALLGRENGALAVLGHIDRAWSSSYRMNGLSEDQSFRDVIERILAGRRLGSATDQFNVRWAALSVQLSETLLRMKDDPALAEEAAQQLKVRDDARNYLLHGDPAVRLRTDERDMPRL
ncbi:hypothetical protein F183_A21600 [Bryobacterales bacterium F-183]|nr:hypothetical protein F183_A21600 [Bryobacterales bacterium F-183]